MKKNDINQCSSIITQEDKEMNKYYTITELLAMISKPYGQSCSKLYLDNQRLFEEAAGSKHNHQMWSGGYMDHVREIMNLAVVLHGTLGNLRPLPFSVSDALLVLFIHDLEKPWMYAGDASQRFVPNDKNDRHAFRVRKLAEYGITLSEEQNNAFRYVEGEVNGSYTPGQRSMNELAAFCHICDVASARLWHDRPLMNKEAWGQRGS